MLRNLNNNRGVNFLELLQIAFIVLKLCKVIDWSWWWIFAPTWGSILLVAGIFLGYTIWCKRH
ncbi:MAG: hypothetical protein IJE78_06200 [Bacteroidaceae bacterium]|nr:hypothetical protein [Bacteroidaceae bacterium]